MLSSNQPMAAPTLDFPPVLDLILALETADAPDPVLPSRTLLPEHKLWLEQHQPVYRSALRKKGTRSVPITSLVRDIAHQFLHHFFPWLSEAQHLHFHNSHWRVSWLDISEP